MNDVKTLLEEYEKYNTEAGYPMHMPGHKRNTAALPEGAAALLPYAVDYTEVPGLDDLHEAEGILRRAMDRTASLYGARRTWYLVNGSTCGNLAAIRAAVPFGGEIIAARNCHKSVYHAIELLHLRAHFVEPGQVSGFSVCGSLDPQLVEEALRTNPGSQAVIVTSPTYEGVVSDIRAIAAAAHRYGVPLIVDEAHGAHLVPGLSGRYGFPEGACGCGADIVIQSAHKTLSSLTQTAWMHLFGDLVSEKVLERQLDVFETSSPSYPLMASLDACTALIADRGDEVFAQWEENLTVIRETAGQLENIRVLCAQDDGACHAFDPSKIYMEACRGSGAFLIEALTEEGFIPEMRTADGVLCMTGAGDDPAAIRQFAGALRRIDARAPEHTNTDYAGTDVCEAERLKNGIHAAGQALTGAGAENAAWKLSGRLLPDAPFTIASALESESEEVPEQKAVGRVLAQYLWVYPPGVPFGVPGETVTAELLSELENYRLRGLKVVREGSGSCEEGHLAVMT